MKNDRLFQILYILLEKQTATASQLASLLEVSVRTVYRDIDTLSAAGIPVYSTAGKGGGISILPGYTFDKSLLTEKERDQILFALQSLKATDQDFDSLLTKLGSVLKKSQTNWIEVDFSRWGYKKTDAIKFEKLKQAILERRIIQIRYASTYGETTERRIKPLRLIFKAQNWYMQGFCLKAQNFRTFKMNRILELFLTEDSFTEEFINIPPIEGSSPPVTNTIKLILKFAPQVAFRVYDEFDDKDIEKQEDGSVLLSTSLPFDQWIYSYILSFGTAVEIIEPPYMKEELLLYLKKIEKHFEI